MRRRARTHTTKRPLRPVRDRDGVTMASMLRGVRCEDVFSEGLLTLQKCQVMLSPRHFPEDFIQANCLVIRLIDWRLTIGGLID